MDTLCYDTGRERIEMFRLGLINIVLAAVGWIGSAGTVADILRVADRHSRGGQVVALRAPC